MLKSQTYSSIVFENVSRIAGEDGEAPRRYKSLCKRAGGIFRIVGLVQFAAFVAAKATREDHYAWLSEHLRQELNEIGLLQSTGNMDYLDGVRNLALPEYMNVSRTVLRLLQWHKNVSDILIEGETDNEGE